MGVETNSPYQQLIEKTKALSFRCQFIPCVDFVLNMIILNEY